MMQCVVRWECVCAVGVRLCGGHDGHYDHGTAYCHRCTLIDRCQVDEGHSSHDHADEALPDREMRDRRRWPHRRAMRSISRTACYPQVTKC